MEKRRRGYLKHYNDATVGNTLSNCLMNHEPYCVVLFWYIIELCNQNNDNKGSIELDRLSRVIWCRSDKLLKIISNSSRLLPELNLSLVGDKLEFFVTNYAEYQDTRSTNNPRKRDESAHIKIKIKDKRLKIQNSDFSFEGNAGLAANITLRTELPEFYETFDEEIKEGQEKYPSLNVKAEFKRVLILYQKSENLEMPQTRSHWRNIFKKKLQSRQAEIDALAARGLRESWDDAHTIVSYLRI